MSIPRRFFNNSNQNEKLLVFLYAKCFYGVEFPSNWFYFQTEFQIQASFNPQKSFKPFHNFEDCEMSFGREGGTRSC